MAKIAKRLTKIREGVEREKLYDLESALKLSSRTARLPSSMKPLKWQ
jgi:ribosomal protein L1